MLKSFLHYIKDAMLDGVSTAIANIVTARIEDAHDRYFEVGDYAPDDHNITFELEAPCEPGCKCDGCADNGAGSDQNANNEEE